MKEIIQAQQCLIAIQWLKPLIVFDSHIYTGCFPLSITQTIETKKPQENFIAYCCVIRYSTSTDRMRKSSIFHNDVNVFYMLCHC